LKEVFNMARIFGFEIKRKKDDIEQNVSFASPVNDDGAVQVENSLGGSYGIFLDIEGTAKNESELITRYRNMALQPEIQQAVDEIVNETITVDSHEKVVEIVLDDTNLNDKIKDRIVEEFENVLRLFDFSNQGYEIFSKFFVDGRINYHIIIDEKNLKDGIKELRYIDPRKIRLIRETDAVKTDNHVGTPLRRVKSEYFMYSDHGFGGGKPGQTGGNYSVSGLRISKDSIARVTSGIVNENNTLVLSYLHKAIKPLNQLRILEDALVIYTITRAPERRIFYVDVGNLPKAKAEQYLADMMARHKNKLQYDSTTGEISASRKFMTMTEDFWFPRREGNRTTEVDILAGGSAPGLTGDENLQYFQRKLYKALGVPVSRLEPENMYSFGRVSEMSRDEIRFSKFIRRLRARFSQLFDIVLEKQLILKGILTPDEWKEIQDSVRYDFMKDNYFEELKQMEILREKVSTLRDVDELVGKYFSRGWVQKNVLFMTDDEMREIMKQIEAEKQAGLYGGEGEQDDDYGAESPERGPGRVPGRVSSGDTRDGDSDVEPDPEEDDEEQAAEESLKIINRIKERQRNRRKK
jgi:hypothetical protein